MASSSSDDSTNLPEKPSSYYFETGVIHNYASCLFVTLDSKIEEPGQIVQVQDRLMQRFDFDLHV